ncbi:MAG: DUF2974 domain-containing protein [Ruminococcaceae bacterium]|nr:DUF2974 domain-containing protein [Oscillospiraceae bacterium]
MPNIIDYIDWRGDLTFEQSRLNEVDNALLVFFSFLDMKGIVPSEPGEKGITLREATEKYFERIDGQKISFGAVIPTNEIHTMAKKMAASVRFGSAMLSGFTDKIDLEAEEQFAAYTAKFDDGSIFISFRGTDDTLVGWKEDLNMSFTEETSGQKSAVEYLFKVSKSMEGPIRLGGHSKGGNLAVYSAAQSPYSVRQRIFRIYNNDGPGFAKGFLESEGYADIKRRIVKLVPQDSVIGMMLYNDDNYTVIKSARSGIDQHNTYLWQVQGKRFLRVGKLTQKTVILNNTLNRWLEDKDMDTRRELCSAVYEIMTAANAKTLTDFSKDKLLLIRSVSKIEPQKRDMVFRALSELVTMLVRDQAAAIAPKPREKASGKNGVKTAK